MIYWEEPYEKLVLYLTQNGYKKPLIVCDENTYKVCGKKVQEYIQKAKLDYKLSCFSQEVIADEYALGKLVFNFEKNDILIGVGSGTITDITRYVAYKLNVPFCIFPTAPSMDGFTSVVAALTINNLKTTVSAKPPEALFIDMDVVKNSPEILKKAGFGDLMGKITALLDWRLSNTLTGEEIEIDVLNEVRQTYLKTLYSVGSEEFEKNLLEGLIMSGHMMVKVGSSRPASGSEHHVSHFLEYHKVKAFHGIKVGLATLYIIKFYQNFLRLTSSQIRDRLEYNINIDNWENLIKRYFGYTYEQVIENNIKRIESINDMAFRNIFINNLIEKKNMLNKIISEEIKILDDLILAYNKLGFPTSYDELPIDKELFKMAFICSPNIRDRFTILHLYQILGLTDEVVNTIID